MDQFEKFISGHKESFAEGNLDREKIWSRIESDLDYSKNSKFRRLALRWTAAAAVIVLLLFAGMRTKSLSGSDTAAYHELTEVDRYYKVMLAHKIDELRSSDLLSESEMEEFLAYFDELEFEYRLLRDDLKEDVGNKAVMEAIVENLRKRIELIEDFIELSEDEKMKEHENQISL